MAVSNNYQKYRLTLTTTSAIITATTITNTFKTTYRNI